MVDWHDDHYIDDAGVRWALECSWSPESVEVTIPDFLIQAVQNRAPRTPYVTAAVTPPPRTKLPPGVNLYRIYIQGELPKFFGHGWHTLKATIGLKWVRLEDAKGRSRRIKLDKFNLMNPELLADDGPEQGHAGDVASAQDEDGGAARCGVDL